MLLNQLVTYIRQLKSYVCFFDYIFAITIKPTKYIN